MGILNNETQNTLDQILFYKNKNKWTDVEFERKLGLNAKTIDKWKRGTSKSFTKILFQISDVLGIPVDQLRGIDRQSTASETQQGVYFEPNDPSVIILRRNRQQMPQKDKDKMMKVLAATFDDYDWEE